MKKYAFAFGLIPIFTFAMGSSFSDVSTDHEFYDALEYVQSEGIVSGYPDGTFQPEKTINRAEFLKIIIEAMHRGHTPTCAEKPPFSDVPENTWFTDYVCSAVEQGIIQGYDDGTFRPSQTINFAEAAKIILNALETDYSLNHACNKEGICHSLRDGSLLPWYYAYVNTLTTQEKLPRPDILPSDLLTRGEMAEIIYKIQTERASEEVNKQGSQIHPSQTPMIILPPDTPKPEEETKNAPSMSATYEDYSASKESDLKGSQTYALYFKADWCPTCALFDKNLTEMISSFPDGTVILKANYDLEEKLKGTHNVTHQTTFVVIDETGNKIFHEVNPDISGLKTFWE